MIEDLCETIELLREDIQWLRTNEWTKDFLMNALGKLDSHMARIESELRTIQLTLEIAKSGSASTL